MTTKKELTKKKLNGFITDHHKQQLRLTNKQFSYTKQQKKCPTKTRTTKDIEYVHI